MSEFCEHRNGAETDQCRIALIGVGANLPGPNGQSPLETCKRAVAMLDGLAGWHLVGLSRWFGSTPVPQSDQPPYVNAVALLRADRGSTIDPGVLLACLMDVEAVCGRERGVPNAARTLDLDIIGIGDLVRDAPHPIVPHPRAHLRAFVLAPLADVAPDWVHPMLDQSAAALLAAVPSREIWPL